MRGLGAHLEMTVRSISSLSETLHQSFWQYILPQPNFMVTVEEYGFVLLLMTLCVPSEMYSTLMNDVSNVGRGGVPTFGVQLKGSAWRAIGIAVGVASLAVGMLYWLEGQRSGAGGDGAVPMTPFHTLAEWWIVSMLCQGNRQIG